MSLRASLKQLWHFHRHHNGFVILQRYADQHLTPGGKAVFLLFLFSLSLGMVGTDVLVYVLLCSLAALWVSELSLGALWRPRQLSLQWQVPERALAGQPFDFEVQVSHASRPVFACFVEIEWQQAGLTRRVCSAQQFCLGRGQTGRFRVTLPAAARGQARLLRANLVSVFPLGLVFWRQPLPCQTAYWVYPVASTLVLPLPPHSATPVQQPEFQSLRPWGTGDSPRYLHWPALARTGQLVVRHYQQHDTRTTLWLDAAPPAAALDFEAAVALMRRLLEDGLQQSGSLPELVLGDSRIGPAQGYALALQALCSVQPEALTPEQEQARLQRLLQRPPARLLLISTRAEALAARWLTLAGQQGSPGLIYAVQEAPPAESAGLPLQWLPTPAVLS